MEDISLFCWTTSKLLVSKPEWAALFTPGDPAPEFGRHLPRVSKPGVGSLICAWQRRMCYILSKSPLVQHLSISWRPASQPSRSLPRTYQWRIQDFPRGGQLPKWVCLPIFSAENCMKMKEFGPPRGACVPGAPLDQPLLTSRQWWGTKLKA